MAIALLDDDILEAVDVLAHAVERMRMQGVVEFRLLTNALRRTLDSRSDRELQEAARVFQTLEPELRIRILKLAETEAHTRAGHPLPVEEALPLTPAAPSAEPAAGKPRAPRSIGSSFLAALNGMRPSQAASRSAAKDRLLMAVEDQRGLVDSDQGGDRADNHGDSQGAGQDGEPAFGSGALRPGKPLPRSSWSRSS